MTRRCAIYTRKSDAAGLEQDFNSLDAQREACEAYIASQKSEGWKLIKKRYDDGGLSGGTMDRPALQELMEDIAGGRVDIIVVYKIDRLTRSLADFAKMVERFDEHEVSFVSVTQQFSTSSSMGRLTLNVLLSFAQFEREVGAERVRDKIAASRKKGIWTGGQPPLGYDNVDKKLVVNAREAEIVRQVFALYLETGCVRTIVEAAAQNGWTTKTRANRRGGKLLSRGPVYHMLGNPIYAGLIRQSADFNDGLHEAIVERATWEAVQKKRAANRQQRRSIRNRSNPLAGKLFADGHKLTPTHTIKDGRRYRYYISHAGDIAKTPEHQRWRLRADDVERGIVNAVRSWLGSADAGAKLKRHKLTAADIAALEAQLKDSRTQLNQMSLEEALTKIADALQRIDLHQDRIEITAAPAKLLDTKDAIIQADKLKDAVSITAPLHLKRRGVELRLIIGETTSALAPDQTAVDLIRRAHQWKRDWIETPDLDLTAIATRHNSHKSDVSKQIRLAFLAPDITQAILNGAAPIDLTAERLRRLTDLPGDWSEQRQLLGFK